MSLLLHSVVLSTTTKRGCWVFFIGSRFCSFGCVFSDVCFDLFRARTTAVRVDGACR